MPKKSKKQSGTKTAAELRHESSTFYVDDCMGKAVVAILRAKGWKVEWHRDHFKRDNVTDCEIYEYLNGHGWHFLTKDKKLRKRPHEVADMVRYGICVFSLTVVKDMQADAIAGAFDDCKRDIGRLLHKNDPPFVAYVSAKGVVMDSHAVERVAKVIEAQTAAADPPKH